MSDNKNLSDDLDDMLGDAKRSAREFANETKKTAREFAEDTKRTANDFETDFNKVKSDGKNVAVIAHLTIIGWIVAIIMNSNPKNEFASFYIRQMLGLMICGFILNLIPNIGWILSLGIFILWIVSLIGALNGEEKLTPGIGQYFQDWFKSL